MFDYSQNIRSKHCVRCTPDIFETVARSARVATTCAEIADCREEKLRGEITPGEFEAKKAELKRRLPVFCFHAHFKNGRRLNADAAPSGLSILDIDHIQPGKPNEGKETLYATLLGHMLRHEPVADEETIGRLKALGIVLVHVTPSGEGLRLVFALPQGMGLVEGQLWLAKQIGLDKFDEACKDLARCSFAVPEDYVLYIDKEGLFCPRQASPKGMMPDHIKDEGLTRPQPPEQTLAPENIKADGESGISVTKHPPLGGGLAGNSVAIRIFDEAVRAAGLTIGNMNAVGTRHNSLITILSMGICRLMPQEQLAAVVARRMPEYSQEKDCQDLIRDFYDKYTDPNRPMSAGLRKIYTDSLKAGSPESQKKDTETDVDIDPEVTQAQNISNIPSFRRGLGRLPAGLRESLIGVPDAMRMPVLCAILPLAAAYADGVTVRYCDGQAQRLGLMSIIVGPQASGKSACKSKVDLWMRQMEDEDTRAREIEDKWKQAKKSRKANEKAPDDPCVLVRSVPVTISCSTLLRRFKNSRGHCLYSFGEELDTLRKTNGAGSWSSKYDIYRLAFDNGKWGQDYNSDQAESGVVEVAYNFSILGTYGALRKCFRGDNVENGLSSRMMIAEMPDSAFAPMPVYGQPAAEAAAAIDKAVTLLRSAQGFVDTPRLREAIGKWVEEKRLEAMANADLVADTYRKRAAVIGFRCGAVARLLEGEESEEVLGFATTMAQYVLDEQCRIFGESLRNEYKQASADEQQRKTENATVFDMLPGAFTPDDIKALKPSGANYNTIRTIVSRWKSSGWIQKIGRNKWQKLSR